MTDFTQLPDLASERFGGAVLWATDEFFAPKENLLREAAPVWKEGEYTDRGKWMDGWESRRHRAPDHDWCFIRLGLPGIVRGVVVDTAFFRGNFPEAAALEGCVAPADATPEALASAPWVTLVERSMLSGDAKNPFAVACTFHVTHLRLRIFPDGGVARLRVHGEPLPDLDRVRARGEIDLAALDVGGRVLAVTDSFFSSPHHLLQPGAARGMHDGWETRRRRGPGHDEAILRLGIAGHLTRVELDTSYFRGNFPQRAAVDAALTREGPWREIVPESPLQAHTLHGFPLPEPAEASYLRLRIYPDGGVARLRAWGRPTETGWRSARLRRLDALHPDAAYRELHTCCGSSAWARAMVQARPFGTPEALAIAAGAAEAALTHDDWREAFAAHPPIGGKKADDHAPEWSAQEQRGMADADAELRRQMAEGNAAYRDRFGYTYIVCATGRSADEMLTLLRERLQHDPATELAVAAAEQARITRIRLGKLLS